MMTCPHLKTENSHEIQEVNIFCSGSALYALPARTLINTLTEETSVFFQNLGNFWLSFISKIQF